MAAPKKPASPRRLAGYAASRTTGFQPPCDCWAPSRRDVGAGSAPRDEVFTWGRWWGDDSARRLTPGAGPDAAQNRVLRGSAPAQTTQDPFAISAEAPTCPSEIIAVSSSPSTYIARAQKARLAREAALGKLGVCRIIYDAARESSGAPTTADAGADAPLQRGRLTGRAGTIARRRRRATAKRMKKMMCGDE